MHAVLLELQFHSRHANPSPTSPSNAGARSRDFTDPLRPYEVKKPSVRRFFRWLAGSVAPFMPPGMRHNGLPLSGIMARNRICAYKAALAHEWSVRSSERAESQHGRRIMQAGADAAWRQLRDMQTLEELESMDPKVLVERAITREEERQAPPGAALPRLRSMRSL
jgi:hypothetical protein